MAIILTILYKSDPSSYFSAIILLLQQVFEHTLHPHLGSTSWEDVLYTDTDISRNIQIFSLSFSTHGTGACSYASFLIYHIRGWHFQFFHHLFCIFSFYSYFCIEN